MNLRQIEKQYDKIFDEAVAILSLGHPCQFNTNSGKITCLGCFVKTRSKSGTFVNPNTLCCAGCKFHSNTGCTAHKPLFCKVALCDTAFYLKSNREVADKLDDLIAKIIKTFGIPSIFPRKDKKEAIAFILKTTEKKIT